jgi:hypothetical protein
MLRPVGCFAVAISVLFLVSARSGSDRGREGPSSSGASPSATLRFVDGGLPLPEERDRALGVGGDPRVWASMLTELEKSGRNL